MVKLYFNLINLNDTIPCIELQDGTKIVDIG